MFDSDYLLYIFYTGRIYKIGLVKTRESLDRRFKQLYKNLFESDPIIRDKIKFCRVYEGMLDVDVKTCENRQTNTVQTKLVTQRLYSFVRRERVLRPFRG